jgi:predicted RNase H-like HicB family nuclease
MSETYNLDLDREEDGRWIAEIAALPGVTVYGESREDALAKCQALALRVLADRIEHGEPPTGQDKLELGFLAA